MAGEGKDVTIQGPFDPEMWDMTIIHGGRSVRIKFSELGWRFAGAEVPFYIQDEVERALEPPSPTE